MECWIYDDTQELRETQASNFKVLNDNVKRCFDKCGEIQVKLDNRLPTDELKSGVAELKSDVNDLKSGVAELKSDVAELKSGVAELKTTLENLNCKLDKIILPLVSK